MARTLNFLTEHGLTDLDALAAKTKQAVQDLDAMSSQMKQAEKQMAEIADLKIHIINYAKTREVYRQYQKSRFKEPFRAEHETELLLHEAAKRAFDAQGVKKLPTIAVLQAEHTELLTKKQAMYSGYTKLKQEARELQTIQNNVEQMLGHGPQTLPPEKGQSLEYS